MINRSSKESIQQKGLVVIDGPAGSGKTSSAKELARILRYRHLDSGALYRATTFALLNESISIGSWSSLQMADFRNLNLQFLPQGNHIKMFCNQAEVSSELRSVEVTEKVPYVASLPEARQWLLDIQRNLGSSGCLVADGRDMGAVVFPTADVKIFLTASLEVRATRRLRENFGDNFSKKKIEEEMILIRERDLSDQNRRYSPLVQAEDAIEVDTTKLTFKQQLEVLAGLCEDLTDAQ